MSSRRRAIPFAVLALLALAACGFQPLYGARDATAPRAEDNLARVSVDIIADRTGQMLRNELDTRLDPNNQNLDARYRLKVDLHEAIDRFAVRRDASATRANLTLTANYQLLPVGGGAAIYAGTVRSVNSYDILSTENEFGTLTARDEARRRAARDLSDQIAVRLALALDRYASPGTGVAK